MQSEASCDLERHLPPSATHPPKRLVLPSVTLPEGSPSLKRHALHRIEILGDLSVRP